MGQRQDAEHLAALPCDEIVAVMAKAFLNNRLPGGEVEKSGVRPALDEAVPVWIRAVQAIDLQAVG